MVTRRRLLAGSAAALGTLAVARAAAAGGPRMALPAGATSGFRLPGGLTCPVPFMSRSAWGADESLRYSNNGGYWPEDYYPTKVITVHHTGFAADPDPAVTVREIYTRQTLSGDGNAGSIGWGDIGYNLLIDDQGVVYEGRFSGSDGLPVFNPSGLMVTGAHVKHYNTGNIGVCLLGYLDDASATQAAQDSLVTVLAYLAAAGQVDPTGAVSYVNQEAGYQNYTRNVMGISGHRDWAATDCPGSAFYPLLGGIRSRTAAALPKPVTTQPSEPSPSPSTTDGGGQPGTPAPTTNPPTAAPTPGSRDRGGDEYVVTARKASPSAYPTKKPSPKPTVTATPTSTPTLTPLPTPTPAPTPSWTPSSAVVSAVSGSRGPGWGVGATVAGVAAAGALSSLGGWWWRRRRPTPTPELSTMEESATPTDVVVQPEVVLPEVVPPKAVLPQASPDARPDASQPPADIVES
jgi:N-acetylmuramoyl-L-alanine amidase